ETYEYNWYFNPRNAGKQPEPIKEASFFNKYSSYYVGDPSEKVIYLTFDAGYENGTTESILDTLKKHNRSEEHTSELQSRFDLVCRLLLEKKKKYKIHRRS